MDHFYIITNNEKDKNLEFTGKVVDYLKKRNRECEVQLAGRQKEGPFHYTDPRKIPEETQCVIVLGGDGTLLQGILYVRNMICTLFQCLLLILNDLITQDPG